MQDLYLYTARGVYYRRSGIQDAGIQVPLPDRGARVAIMQKKLRRVQAELREQKPAWARKEFVPRVWFDMAARTTVDPAAAAMPPLPDLCATVSMTEVRARPPARSAAAASLPSGTGACCVVAGRVVHHACGALVLLTRCDAEDVA